MINVLLVNHSLSKFCGIYAHGVRMFNILKNSLKYKFIYAEIPGLEELKAIVELYSIKVVIYNYTKGLLPFAPEAKSAIPSVIHIGLGHDVLPQLAQSTYTEGFDYRIALDPTLETYGRWFTSVRPLFGYSGRQKVRGPIPKIGSFGFYFPHKNFDKVLVEVIKSIPEAEVNFHITKAHFSSQAHKDEFDRFVNWANSVAKNNNTKLNITSNYVTDQEQIDFLANNDLNIFLYSGNYGMGPSSAIDYAVAAGSKILINDSYQFKHVAGRIPSITKVSIRDALAQGNEDVLTLRAGWSEENFLSQYETILDKVISNELSN